MQCLILDGACSGLQHLWQGRLFKALEAENHAVHFYPNSSWLHHENLQRGLREFDDEDIDDLVAIWESDTYPRPGWGNVVRDLFAADPRCALVGAQHVWRRFAAGRGDVVGESWPGWPGHLEILPDNVAAWWSVFHVDRLRAAGLHLGDFDWSPTTPPFIVHRQPWPYATGGDTGARVIPALRAAGLTATLLATEPRPYHLGVWVKVPGEADPHGQRLVAFHLFHGRAVGVEPPRPIDCGYHWLDGAAVTDSALAFMKEYMA